MKLASVHRLAQERSPITLSDEMQKTLGRDAQDLCVTVSSHMRRHLDMPNIDRLTNFDITRVGARAYQVQTTGLTHVLVRA